MTHVWADPIFARLCVCTIVCIAVVISTLEWLVPLGKLGTSGLFDSAAFRSARMERLLRPYGLILVLGLRLASATLFLLSVALGLSGPEEKLSVLTTGLLCLPLRLSSPFGILMGMDGAEHLFPPILLVLGITFVLKSSFALEVALGFVAVQVSLEYAGAGWSKAVAWRSWLKGPSLLQVLSSSNYGHLQAAAFIKAHPQGGRLASAAVIAIEMAAPAALVLPPPFAESLLIGLLVMHLATAVFMGLNTFPLAFLATYPAILHCRDRLLSL